MASSPRWLDVVHHRISGFRAPYLLVVQHHDIPAITLLVAPVLVAAGRCRRVDQSDAILSAIDIILHGYPVGRPR